jgi:hypothetical protein
MAVSLLAAVPAYAQRGYATVRVGDSYSGAALEFRTAPRMTLIPNTRVYYINDSSFDRDLYRIGDTWYYVEDGNWYRASSWRGPFIHIRDTTVPVDVIRVPARYRMTWSSGAGRRYESRPVVRVGEYYEGDMLPLRVQPAMMRIPGTRVFYIRSEFDNDLYRFGNRWYYVEDGVWYSAPSWRGPFRVVRFRDVPASVRTVPTRYRRSWTYSSPTYRPRYESAAGSGVVYRGAGSFRLGINEEPSMAIIPGTRVYYLRDDSDVDLYRYGNTWYMVDNGVWHRASSWRGPFYRITMGSVPNVVLTIPAGYRKTWVY